MIKIAASLVPNVTISRLGRNHGNHDCAVCEIRGGIPLTSGWGYYASRGGARMLVVERRLEQRIRINGTIEIIVLEADGEKVRLGVRGIPTSETRVQK